MITFVFHSCTIFLLQSEPLWKTGSSNCDPMDDLGCSACLGEESAILQGMMEKIFKSKKIGVKMSLEILWFVCTSFTIFQIKNYKCETLHTHTHFLYFYYRVQHGHFWMQHSGGFNVIFEIDCEQLVLGA